MKTRLTALALTLVTFTMLGTACDVEPTLSSDELSFRGDELDPPRPTTGGGIIVKGGHDLPFEVLQAGFHYAALDYQLAFLAEVEKVVVDTLEQQFLSDEHVVEECRSTCEHEELEWTGDVELHGLKLGYGEVVTERGEGEQLEWVTEADATAEVDCVCG